MSHTHDWNLRTSLTLLLAICLVNGATAAEKRYTVRFSDGSYHEGDQLVNWHEDNAQPQVDGRSLLDPANPFRWLHDRRLSPGNMPTAFVEMITGDCLPGVVIGYVESQNSFEPLPPYFIVEPQVALQSPDSPTRLPIRVIAASVKRIVGQAGGNKKPTANTLTLTNGSSITFRALRFTDQQVSVLANEGNRRIDYHEIGELTLPSPDFWKQYLTELSTLTPQGTSRLYQLETTDRLRATSSLERLVIHNRGNNSEPHQWVHGIQPAWSLDILWVPNANVWMRRSFHPREIALSAVPPSSVEHRATLGTFHEPWRRDCNTLGDLLRSGKNDVGYGFGTTTTTTLTFALPIGAKSLRGGAGMDRLAGSGGCARARIEAGEKELTQLWESPVLIGSDNVHDWGSLQLPSMLATQKLVLKTEAMHEGRPAGADPFEVRDFVDWVDPLLKFEEKMWTDQIRQQAPATIPAWSQWNVDLAPLSPEKPGKLVPFIDKRLPTQRSFRMGTLTEQPLVLRRQMTFETRDRWLLIYANRVTDQSPETRIEVHANGELLADWKVPKRDDNPTQDRPLAVSLAGLNGRKELVNLEVRYIPGPNPGPLEWRSIRTCEELPYVRRIFEEEEKFTATNNSANKPEFITKEPFTGLQAFKLAAPGEAMIKFDPPLKIRNKPEFNEHRMIRIVIKKKGGGQVLLRWEGDIPGGVAEQVVGRGPIKPVSDAYKWWDDEFKDGWVDLHRDLLASLGNCDLTSLTLVVPDGEYACFDHIYAGTTWDDTYGVPRGPVPSHMNNEAKLALVPEPAGNLKKHTVLIDFGEGRWGNGVLIHGAGEIITAGHLIVEPNRDCTVHFPNGKSYPAKTRGIARDYDLGMVKLAESFGLFGLGVNGWTIPVPDQLYLTATHRRDRKPEDPPEVTAAAVRRELQSRVWTDFSPADKLCGSPLLGRDNHVLAILHRYSENGGAVYSSLHKWGEIDKKMQNGEVWGKWIAGSSPSFGAELMATREGLRVKELVPDGPAMKAGVEKDDLLIKLDGQPIATLQDIDAALGERNAGHEATFQFKRRDQTPEMKIKLVPRMP